MKIRKRWLAVLLSVCLVFTMLPMGGSMAQAADGITYLTYENGSWQTKTQDNYTEVKAGDTTWSDGWYVAQGNVTLSSRVTVNGDVHLILADGCTLNTDSRGISGGITVAEGNSLTIYAQSTDENIMGKLTSTGRFYGAGIGGGEGGAGGTVTINGGTVTAIGGYESAGIGGGGNGGAGGTITINGGTVIATGGFDAAGIGGGDGDSGGTITINGGTVTATGGSFGAGIGGGYKGAGDTITINGGTVTATGGFGGTGIGGGYGGAGRAVTVNGGTVTAISGSLAAGIGGGDGGAGGTITINGGTVTAGGDYGVGIGGGSGGAGGTFTTGDSSNAVIFATSISDQSGKGNWNGIIFEGNSGKVYSETVTPTEDFTIDAGKTLTVPDGSTLTIEDGITLTNNGAIINNGAITIFLNDGGYLNGSGTITGNPVKYEANCKTNYLDEDGNRQTTDVTVLIPANTTLGNAETESWYLVNNDVTFNSRITVTGKVHLILADGCTLNANSGGINVTGDNSLTIYAQSTDEKTMGKLTATGGDFAAGIGSGRWGAGGTITINGGAVTATSGLCGAGIGGGDSGAGGTITINGGDVTATGGSGGAGIGGGDGGTGGTITISGGTVAAKGGFDGAGIGGGYKGAGGTITISGGIITVTGGDHGAGIGGGSEGTGGTITISGGIITATGGEGKSMSIIDGIGIMNYGEDGAGIGGGDGGAGGTITISGGIIKATGSDHAAGIGGGNSGENGSFNTTESGNAVIIANSISDKSDNESWNGVIFEGNSGRVYGETVTPTEDFTIDEGKTLTVPSDSELVITDSISVTNNGTIKVDGVLDKTSADRISGNLPIYKLTIYGGTSTATGGYAAAGETITLTESPALAGQEFIWMTSDPNVQVVDNTFTMPAGVLTVVVNAPNTPDDEPNDDSSDSTTPTEPDTNPTEDETPTDPTSPTESTTDPTEESDPSAPTTELSTESDVTDPTMGTAASGSQQTTDTPKSADSGGVQTGDTTSITLLWMLIGISVASLAVIGVALRKKKY